MEQTRALMLAPEQSLLPYSPHFSWQFAGGFSTEGKELGKLKHFVAMLQKHLLRNGKFQVLLLPDLSVPLPVPNYGADLWQPPTFRALERVRQPCPPSSPAFLSQLRLCWESMFWPHHCAFFSGDDALTNPQDPETDLVLFTAQASSSQRLLKTWMLRLKALTQVNPWLLFLLGSVVQLHQMGHFKLASSGNKVQWGVPSPSRVLGHCTHGDRDPLQPVLTYRRKLKRRSRLMF